SRRPPPVRSSSGGPPGRSAVCCWPPCSWAPESSAGSWPQAAGRGTPTRTPTSSSARSWPCTPRAGRSSNSGSSGWPSTSSGSRWRWPAGWCSPAPCTSSSSSWSCSDSSTGRSGRSRRSRHRTARPPRSAATRTTEAPTADPGTRSEHETPHAPDGADALGWSGEDLCLSLRRTPAEVPRSPPGLEDRGRTRCGSPCDRQEGRGRGRRGVNGRRIRNEGRARRGDLTAALPRAGDDDRQGTQPRRRQRPPLSISRTRHRTDTIELTRDPMLRVAVPNKGAPAEAATDMLGEAGYSTRRGSKTLVHQDEVNGVEFFYLRPRDIAIYVGSGILDAGITGRDLLLESQAPAQEVLGLG